MLFFSDTKFLNFSFLKEHKQLVMFMCVLYHKRNIYVSTETPNHSINMLI